MEIAASTSLAYLSKSDIRRHIHEGMKPFQRLADQAGMHFLSYLISMALEEAGFMTEKKSSAAPDGEQPDDGKDSKKKRGAGK